MVVLALSGALLPSCGQSFRDSMNSFLTVFNAKAALRHTSLGMGIFCVSDSSLGTGVFLRP